MDVREKFVRVKMANFDQLSEEEVNEMEKDWLHWVWTKF